MSRSVRLPAVWRALARVIGALLFVVVLALAHDAFFSLERLADFLQAAPLDLALALNLDGGPVASQAVALNGFRRKTCGRFELAAHDDHLSLLHDPAARCQDMPIALAVLPK
jgi:hypothetical protein